MDECISGVFPILDVFTILDVYYNKMLAKLISRIIALLSLSVLIKHYTYIFLEYDFNFPQLQNWNSQHKI